MVSLPEPYGSGPSSKTRNIVMGLFFCNKLKHKPNKLHKSMVSLPEPYRSGPSSKTCNVCYGSFFCNKMKSYSVKVHPHTFSIINAPWLWTLFDVLFYLVLVKTTTPVLQFITVILKPSLDFKSCINSFAF